MVTTSPPTTRIREPATAPLTARLWRMMKSRAATPYLLLAPYLVVISIALIYPLIQSVILSFQDWKLGMQPEEAEFIGFANYLYLLGDPFVWRSVGVTLTFAFAVVSLEMVAGIGLALLLNRQMRGLALLRTIFILPMMVAPIVVGLIWRFMYNEQFGILNKLLRLVGLGGVPWLSSPDMALASIIIADVWQWTPFVFILSLAALQSLPASALEAARMDGATPWQSLWMIKLPLIMPVIVVTALLRLIDAFKVLEVIFIMTDGGPGLSTEILALHIYKTAFVSQQLGRASALSNLLLLLVLVLGVSLIVFTKLRDRSVARARALRAEADRLDD